ncbi:MAG: peptide ABC transporter substrate-binding protein, partial [Chloroflexi bacterium]|nr:peptide ABC transporter substrate-binding protein [Chloroflexota bacterium]
MKRLRWQILVVVLTLTLVAVLLFSQQPVLAPVSNQPTSGGIYTEAVIGSFGRLNPVFDLHNQADRDVDRLVYSGLIRFDAAGLPQPDLAESWGMSQDGMIYNFSIRPEARWHDGQPVTSDDILFTLSLLRSQFSAYSDDVRALWDQVEITRLDERTLKFTLPEPYAPFLDYLTFGILPQHLLGTVQADQLMNADFNLHPVGSGPYRFDQLLVEDDRIIGVALSVFEDYYGAKPFIEQIVIRYFDSAQAALAAYQEGEALGINQVT